jgi:hypothetical protein
MSVDLFFPVPLLVRDVEPAVRGAIYTKVLACPESESAKEDIAPSPEESVSTTYFRPEAPIVVDAELKELEEIVIGAGTAFLERSLELPPRRLEIERAWTNFFKPGCKRARTPMLFLLDDLLTGH